MVIFETTLGEPVASTKQTTTYALPYDDVLVNDIPSFNLSKYTFYINDVAYTPLYEVIDGETRTFYRYRIEGATNNSINVQLWNDLQAHEHHDIIIRKNTVQVQPGDIFKLVYDGEKPYSTDNYSAVIKFNNYKTIKLIYDGATDKVTTEIINNDDFKEKQDGTLDIIKAIVKFNKTNVYEVTYDKINDRVTGEFIKEG